MTYINYPYVFNHYFYAANYRSDLDLAWINPGYLRNGKVTGKQMIKYRQYHYLGVL